MFTGQQLGCLHSAGLTAQVQNLSVNMGVRTVLYSSKQLQTA